jgi:putative ABC transport system permease protein
MMDTSVPSVFDFTRTHWLMIGVVACIVGIVAGAYPATHLASTNAVDSLKGKLKNVSGTVSLSRALIGLQFTISLFILACAVVMTLQFNYFVSKDLGYDRSQVLLISSVPRLWNADGINKVLAAKELLKRSPSIASASLSLGSPAIQFSMGSDNAYASGHNAQEGIKAIISVTDEDYAEVYELTLLEGAYFNQTGGAHLPSSVVINESLQRALSVRLGDKIKLTQSGDQEFTVAGIVRDFHFESLHEPVKPVAIFNVRDSQIFRYFSLKLRPGDLTAAVQEVEKAWRQAFPDDAFLAVFADERVQQQYRIELKLRKGASLASVLMIVIVMTGVFG